MDLDAEPDPELAELLRARRPGPSMTFVARTERELFPQRPVRRPFPLRLATAFAGGLATLVLVLSLAGVGPLSGGDSSVQAGENCHTARVVRTERVPSVRTDVEGNPTIVYSRREVQRLEKRCR